MMRYYTVCFDDDTSYDVWSSSIEGAHNMAGMMHYNEFYYSPDRCCDYNVPNVRSINPSNKVENSAMKSNINMSDLKVLLDEVFEKYDDGLINKIDYILKCKAIIDEAIMIEKTKAYTTLETIEKYESCNK